MTTTVKLESGVCFRALTSNGHTVYMDGPPESGGENRGGRPLEMLLVGLGGCTGYDVVTILRKSRQQLANLEIVIDAERAAEIPRVYTKIHLLYRFYGKDLDPAKIERAITLSTEKYCSATIMLGQVATVTHSYEILDQ